mgnify:CR=1 FL=1
MQFEDIEPEVRYAFRSDLNYENEVVHHKLSMMYRFLTIIDGGFRLAADGVDEECRRGDVIYMPPGTRYATTFKPGSSEFLNIFFDYTRRGVRRKQIEPISDFFVMTDHEKPDPEKRTRTVEFSDLPEFSRVQVIRGMPDAEIRCLEIYNIFDGAERFTRLRVDSRLASLLADTAHYLTQRRESPTIKIVRRVILYVDGHSSEPLTCKGVAAALGYHPNYLNRLTREYMGMSLHDYIVSVKIRAANRMLSETDMSITDIAYALAFSDSSRFSSVYCAATGMKPSERRRMMQEDPADISAGIPPETDKPENNGNNEKGEKE